jgi:hypothetical protein
MRVQVAALVSWALAFFAMYDYMNNFDCGIQEEVPNDDSSVCAAALNRPGTFICCAPNKFFTASNLGLVGAWMIAFSIAICGGLVCMLDFAADNMPEGKFYGTAEVGQVQDSTVLPMPATQAAAAAKLDEANLGAT